MNDDHAIQPKIVASLSRACFAAAPTFLFLYGVARMFDGRGGNYGPGTAWTVGHVLFLSGLLVFGPVILELRKRIGGDGGQRLLASVAAAASLIGLVIFIRVAVIDILTGLRAPGHAAMHAISSKLNAYPSTILVPFYKFGPLLFQAGLLILMLELAVLQPGRLPWWSLISLFSGFLLLGFNLGMLPLSAVLIGIAFVPLIRKPSGG